MGFARTLTGLKGRLRLWHQIAKSTPLRSGSQCLHSLMTSTPVESYVKESYVDIRPEISH
jgi:hypothetical protein